MPTRHFSFIFLFLMFAVFLYDVSANGEPQNLPPNPAQSAGKLDPKLLLEQMDRRIRGNSHNITLTLHVKTSRWDRRYKIQVQMKGLDYAFARVLEPPKTEGQGFLRIQ